MKSYLIPLFASILVLMFTSQQSPSDFKTIQLQHQRVKTAYDTKSNLINQLLKKFNIPLSELNIYIRVFKKEKKLEIWGKVNTKNQFQLLKSYDICGLSGKMGPKRRQGDGQVPEGFYHIDRFNPFSNFHLSLGINYPNSSDRKLGDQNDPGGDIFIHGNCVSIGCLAMTDQVIEEIYILAVEARNNGQKKIPVTIFPSAMDDEVYLTTSKPSAETIKLWSELKLVYDFFNRNKAIPEIRFLNNGTHQIFDQ